MENKVLWKILMTAMIMALLTGSGVWLTFASSTISRAEAQAMVDQKVMPTADAMKKMEEKQDKLQESMDDMRERLARIEERIR